MKQLVTLALSLLAAAAPVAAPARAAVLGSDAPACSGAGPAILAHIEGLKDRTGAMKLELWPATQEDFLKDDRDLVKQGKFFRRVRVMTPQSGPVAMCIRVPAPGRYALMFTHDRDERNKFNFWEDGAGFPSNQKIGRSKPKLDQAVIDVPNGVTSITIRAQYLRGLIAGFGPVNS